MGKIKFVKEYVNYTVPPNDTLYGFVVEGVSARDVYLKAIETVKKFGGIINSYGRKRGVHYVEGDE
jgi:hypothetical protein